jgi:Ca2+-transporting ATPase
MHIAFLEMFIDPVCAVAFEAEPEDPDVMRRPPRSPNERLFSGKTLLLAVARGAVGLIVVLAVFQLSLWRHREENATRAVTFTALVATDLALVIASRVSPAGRLKAISRPNPTLWGLGGGLIALLAIALSIPAGRALFDFGQMDGPDLATAIAAGLIVLGLGLALTPAQRPRPKKRDFHIEEAC